MAIILRWRYQPQIGAGDVTSLAAIVGPRGLGIASSAWNATTGIMTITYTDASTETLDLSGTFTARDAAIAAQAAAQAAQTAAETAETNAETAETNAAASATAAAGSATAAASSATAAADSATAAASSATDAETAQTAAETAQAGAETAETGAQTAETNAGGSATAAAGSATAAAGSATGAQTAQAAAEAAQAAAETAETNSETAQTGAETAETNAAASATAAASSATAAAASATEAQGYVAAVPMNAAYLGDAINTQPLFKEASLYADFRNQVYARGDRSGLTVVDTFNNLFDFSRSTIRTGFDAAGDLVTFAANAPRFVYGVGGVRKGLSVGPSVTNNAPYSADITNEAWAKTGITVSGTRITEDTTTGTHLIRPATGSFTAGVNYVFYADLGPQRNRNIRLGLPTSAFTSFGFCEIAPNGNVTTGGTQAGKLHGAIPQPDGTIRIWVSATCDTTTSGSGTLVMFNEASNSYTGDGTSGFDLHRFQNAEGVYPGDFVETAESGLTHSPDLLEVKPAVVADVVSATEGTVFVEATVFAPSETIHIVNFAGAVGGSNRLQVTCTVAGSIICSLISGGVTVAGLTLGTIVFGQKFSVAVAYSEEKVSALLSTGFAIQTDSTVSIPTFVDFTVSKNFSNAQVAPSILGKLSYIPRALEDAELQAITS